VKNDILETLAKIEDFNLGVVRHANLWRQAIIDGDTVAESRNAGLFVLASMAAEDTKETLFQLLKEKSKHD
jgi:hypothetical protein